MSSPILQAFIAGRQMRMEREKRAQDTEDRKLQQDVLRHQLAQMKIADRVNAFKLRREGEQAQFEGLQGTPESDLTPQTTEGGVLPAHSLQPGTLQTRMAPVQFSGDQELGIPGFQRRPQTLEEVITGQVRGQRMKALSEPYTIKPGEERRIGSEVIGSRPADTSQEPLDRQYDAAVKTGDTATANRILSSIKATKSADDDPTLAAIRQLQLAQAQSQIGQLPQGVQRRVDAISKGFDAQPVVKRTQTMAEAVSFTQSLNPNTKNPADDQGLIYAFAKAMDPDSVVREGEYATVQKYAQSWADKFGFDAKRVFSNTAFLTPEARKNMKATVEAKYKAGRSQYDNLRTQYAKRIKTVTGQEGEPFLIDYAAAFPDAGGAASSSGWTDAGGGFKVRAK
jgi:hypothetical protein